jgi:5'-nucleotidase
MNILVTNDDGIDGEGFLEFISVLRNKTCHVVYVLVPDQNRSGISNSVTSSSCQIIIKYHSENTWTCSGTPADCVKIAFLGGLPLKCGSPQTKEFFKPDAVISGINASGNVGTDLIYSGTASGARQAGLLGLPGIAISLVNTNEMYYWEPAYQYIATQLDKLLCLWEEDTFLNVNIPNLPKGPGGTLITFPARRWYEDVLLTNASDSTDQRFYSVSCVEIKTQYENGSDWDAIARNYVSISPIFLHPVVRRDCCIVAPEHASVSKRPDFK